MEIEYSVIFLCRHTTVVDFDKLLLIPNILKEIFLKKIRGKTPKILLKTPKILRGR